MRAKAGRRRTTGRGKGKAARKAAAVAERARELDAALLPATLEGAAEEATARAIGDPRRPWPIVDAQVRLVMASGPVAIAAARALAEHAGAFSAAMRGWVAGADEYGRDGAAAEAADAVERGRFARRPGKGPMFTAMSLDLGLGQHEDREVKMLIRRASIPPPVLVAEYHAFRARLPGDAEEIDSPKAAANAFECEVRLPDGARVGPWGVRVMARRPQLGAAAHGQPGRPARPGAGARLEGL